MLMSPAVARAPTSVTLAGRGNTNTNSNTTNNNKKEI